MMQNKQLLKLATWGDQRITSLLYLKNKQMKEIRYKMKNYSVWRSINGKDWILIPSSREGDVHYFRDFIENKKELNSKN